LTYIQGLGILARFGVGFALGNFARSLFKSNVLCHLINVRGRKFCPASPGPQVLEYGGFSKINDTIGILFEFKEGIGSVSFYRNGVRIFILFLTLFLI